MLLYILKTLLLSQSCLRWSSVWFIFMGGGMFPLFPPPNSWICSSQNKDSFQLSCWEMLRALYCFLYHRISAQMAIYKKHIKRLISHVLSELTCVIVHCVVRKEKKWFPLPNVTGTEGGTCNVCFQMIVQKGSRIQYISDGVFGDGYFVCDGL